MEEFEAFIATLNRRRRYYLKLHKRNPETPAQDIPDQVKRLRDAELPRTFRWLPELLHDDPADVTHNGNLTLDCEGGVTYARCSAWPAYREIAYADDAVAIYRPPGVGQVLRYAVGEQVFYFRFSEDAGWYAGVPHAADPVVPPSPSLIKELLVLLLVFAALFAGLAATAAAGLILLLTFTS